ncbi:hypothetical protein AB0K21_21035 [Streptosporangium sp. NPDC049248]|uniref:hypothetical protein n=1 Tax=Streptosporangium sp. NPDC049248 TaxID=3155651 RepID=UPI003447F3DB
MTSTVSALRVPRALVFATLCIAVTGGGHALAGGGLVPPHLALAGMAFAFALAYALNARERGLGVVLTATATSQILLHEVFSRAVPVPAASAEHHHVGLGMILAHLTVALLTGWWLHRGESALWLMIRLHGMPMPVIRPLFVLPAKVPRFWQVIPAADEHPRGGWETAPVPRRRGPPASRPAG